MLVSATWQSVGLRSTYQEESSVKRLLTGGRQAGKTTKLVEWLLEHPDRFLLTAYGKQHIESIVREMLERRLAGVTDGQYFDRVLADIMQRVFTMDDLAVGRRPSARTQVWGIDDLDRVLEHLVRGPVDLASHGLEFTAESL